MLELELLGAFRYCQRTLELEWSAKTVLEVVVVVEATSLSSLQAPMSLKPSASYSLPWRVHFPISGIFMHDTKSVGEESGLFCHIEQIRGLSDAGAPVMLVQPLSVIATLLIMILQGNNLSKL